MGKSIVLSAKKAPAAFFEAILQGESWQNRMEKHPAVHFSTKTGWINDPNGLIFREGVYHLYYQYNPMNVSWNNMTWGHAESRDLIHWQEKDAVLFPDEQGVMFSGSAILNTKGKMNLPEDAIIYYYTTAGGISDWNEGKQFVQSIAWSTDGGRTLEKREEVCIPTIHMENRDPKVFYHEESKSFVMTLWLKDADYGIFRSQDMEHWEMCQQLTFPFTWECPDLFQLTTPEGESCWFFWTAGGSCFAGDFDGYTFTPHGAEQKAYITKRSYAAQTWSNTGDRVISVPWLRLENDGRNFTGAYGIPVEFSVKKTDKGYVLLQNPVSELFANSNLITDLEDGTDKDAKGVRVEEALAAKVRLKGRSKKICRWNINDTSVSYDPESGILQVEEEQFLVKKHSENILFLVDDIILEIFFDDGEKAGAFQLKGRDVSFFTDHDDFDNIELYRIR
ncbi:MAG: glycoside hydrolase family 32 protein [Lachnospiraceae bacterium]|nr:glycoside hydrolase family 32 protein [Lachnospiraceae bacterium]